MKKKKILFFGKKNCKYTQKILNYTKKKPITLTFFNGQDKRHIPKRVLNWNGDYIFSFRSKIILNKKFLKKPKFMAINFHPGPPEFRGIGCANFALLKNSKYYGSTAHVMEAKVDSGPILDVKRFKILNMNLIKILEKSHYYNYLQFMKIFKKILKSDDKINLLIKKSNKFKWSKKLYKKNDLEKLYNINKHFKNIKMINRVILSTYSRDYKPFIKINDKKFYIKK